MSMSHFLISETAQGDLPFDTTRVVAPSQFASFAVCRCRSVTRAHGHGGCAQRTATTNRELRE